MATRQKRARVEPGTCGVCGVTLGTPHSGNCPLGAPPAPVDGATNGHTAPGAADGPLFDIHDLSATENERPAPVRINDTPYQWARFGNFGLRRRTELSALVDETIKIEAIPVAELTDEDEERYATTVDGILDIALPTLSAEHRAVLDRRQREDIAAAFLVESNVDRLRAMNRMRTRQRTGEKPSPPSDASSPATPGGTG